LEGAEIILSTRPLQTRDLPFIIAIQSACPEIAQWTIRDYARVIEGDMAGWVDEQKDEVAGFVVARRLSSELEILNFAVQPDWRNRGIGRALLEHTLSWGATFQGEKAFLEVRASNLAALRFYEHNGFEVTGRRPRYYSAPIEDALVLAAPLPLS
jgi:[ribosomal protein S18]-alanine N-acetyltransferase